MGSGIKKEELLISLNFAGSSADLFLCTIRPWWMALLSSVDLPEPDTPLMQTSFLRGILTLRFLRLFLVMPLNSK